jgi:hypothetical protein
MNLHNRKTACCHCNVSIPPKLYSFSIENFELPFCVNCGEDFKIKSQKTAPLALSLFIELMKRGVPAQLEKWDSNTTVDISIPGAKVNLEVDGGQNNFNADQAMRNLLGTLLAFKNGFLTLRIPNSLVKYNLQHTADMISEFLMESKEQVEDHSFLWK